MYNSIIMIDDVIHADRTVCSDDIADGKELCIWYRAAGYKLATIRLIMSVKFPDMNSRQIKNSITNFSNLTGCSFREYGNKNEWNDSGKYC